MLKKILLFLVSTILYQLSIAQDIIIKQNGNEIKAKVLEINDNYIKYKKFEYQDGPVRNINVSDVFMIIYENGKREKFANSTSSQVTENNSTGSNLYPNFRKRGFIGLELGLNFPMGKFAALNNGAAETGLQINLINFGHLISENMGITATWYSISDPISYSEYSWSIGGLLAGTLFSIPVSRNLKWDIKPMLGISSASVPNTIFEPKLAFVFDFGTGFRLNISHFIALTLNVDYTTAKYKWDLWQQSMQAYAIKGGLAYRIN